MEVKPYNDEPIDSLLKRFRKVVEKEGIIQEYKKHEFYEKPSEEKRKKRARVRKKAKKAKEK